MPASTKVPQEIYAWVDDSGITHFSNTIKKETSILVPPATNHSSPEQSQKQEKPTAQVVLPIIEQHAVKPAIQQNVAKPVMQSQVIKPPQAANGNKVTGLGSLVFMIVIVIAFRLFFENIGKKRRERKRYGKIRELRPEPNPIPPRPFWTLEFIRSLEWREFEKLCATVLETRGFYVKLGNMGADGGTDIHIYKPQELEKLYGIAQCKAHRQEIKVDIVRAFRGVMAAQEITKGFFFTSGGFYKKARAFGEEQGMELVTGDDLLGEITCLPQEKQEAMLQEIVNTDYTTPTCVNCGIKMDKKSSPQSEYQFWGCLNYPRCKNKLELRWTDKEK